MLSTQDPSPAATVNDFTIRSHGSSATGHCLAGDTVLMHATSAWPNTLRSLVDRKEGVVLTMREASVLSPQCPFAFLTLEPAQLYRLTTYTGRSIEATAEQPFLTRDGWKPLSALGPSDTVAVVAEYPQLFGCGDTDAERVKLLAYLTANGTTGDGVAPPLGDPIVRSDFETAVESQGDECGEMTDDGVTRLRVRGRCQPRSKVLGYLDLVGVHGVPAPDKFVPDFVFGLKKDKLRLFLNRLFTCDGAAEPSDRITYRTTSMRMARQVQHLLTRFGVVSLLRGREREGVLEAVELLVVNKADVVRFIDDIGFLGDKTIRAEAIRTSLYDVRTADPPSNRLGPILFDRVVAVEATVSAPVYDLSIEGTHNFVANEFIVHNSTRCSQASCEGR
jgi:replicative DNA helicase